MVSVCGNSEWQFKKTKEPEGQDERTVQVKLKVKDDENDYGILTRTYTIRRGMVRYYDLTDHLGSIRVVVDEDGNSVGFDDYYPFGQIMPGRSTNVGYGYDLYKFTGSR